jgi:hypothetical protein
MPAKDLNEWLARKLTPYLLEWFAVRSSTWSNWAGDIDHLHCIDDFNNRISYIYGWISYWAEAGERTAVGMSYTCSNENSKEFFESGFSTWLDLAPGLHHHSTLDRHRRRCCFDLRHISQAVKTWTNMESRLGSPVSSCENMFQLKNTSMRLVGPSSWLKKVATMTLSFDERSWQRLL